MTPSNTLRREAVWEPWLSDKADRNAIMLSDHLVVQTNARTGKWRETSEDEPAEPDVDMRYGTAS